MNQIVKTVSSTIVPNIRSSTGVRGTPSLNRSPIEGISPQVGADFQEATFAYENTEQGLGCRKDRFGGPLHGTFSSTSNIFASMFEDTEGGGGVGRGGVSSRKGNFAGLVAKAVHIYETNSKIIHGEVENVRGSSLSINL